MVVFENKNYIVKVSEDRSGYLVVNKNTEVIEEKDTTLPNAILLAEQYNFMLVHGTHRHVVQKLKEDWDIKTDKANVVSIDDRLN